MQAAAVNQQHATAPLLDRLLNEAFRLMGGDVRGQVVQVHLGLGLDLAARERADQSVGHTKGCAGQFLALPLDAQ